MIQKTRYTDRQLLVSLLIEALVNAETRLHRPPTRKEIFDELFSGGHDPEAIELMRRLNLVVGELLDEWYA